MWSSLASTVTMAGREIRRSPTRSLLTTLGIVIGVASVIALVTLGEGASQKVRTDVGKMGVNLLHVSPGTYRRGAMNVSATPLTMEDAAAILRQIPAVRAVAPSASRGALLVAGNKNYSTAVIGVTASYFDVRKLRVASGRSFSEMDLTAAQPVCLLGATVQSKLFGRGNPIGSSIRIQKLNCKVIGVLESKGLSTFGTDQDDYLLLPLGTYQRKLAGSPDLSSISVSARESDLTAKAQRQIQQLLRERRGIKENQASDFTVSDMRQFSETLESVTGALTVLLGAVAAVSLIVGGIGIMNIMLVSVTERTREIGTRLAIGARRSDVLLQFLVEAVFLSTLGGCIGVALGLTGSLLTARSLGIPFVFLPSVCLVSFLFSAFVGILFGYLPAHRAAKMNPIDALRSS